MKRKYLAVLCAAVLSACMFTGCGNKDTDNKETAKTASEEQQGTEKDAEEAGISDGSDTEDVQEGSQEEGQSGQPVEDAEDTAEETTQEPEKKSDAASADTGSSEDAVTLDVSKSLTGTHDVEIKVKDYGTIDVQLDADTAPITVTNFIKLVQENFYDGLTFHRIMDGFMIQGGDPLGNGTGGSDQTIKGEFKNNKVENNISHKRGVISMARSSDPDSASSQFFIVQTDSTFLDGDYAAFGEVTSGMDVVDAICKDAKPTDDNGTIPADQQPVIEYIKVLD